MYEIFTEIKKKKKNFIRSFVSIFRIATESPNFLFDQLNHNLS